MQRHIRVKFLFEAYTAVVGFVEGHLYEQSEEEALESGKRKIGVIKELFVSQKYRGQKIGKKLLEAIENYCKDIGCESVTLEVFYPNILARTVYEALGYQPRSLELLKLL